jgi:hypothetical protein
MAEKKEQPLILVFYMDRDLFGTEIMGHIAQSIDRAISERELNAIAFFVPTDGEERIECINPVLVHEADMERIDKIIQDLSKNFDIGQGADKGKNDPENEIKLDDGSES